MNRGLYIADTAFYVPASKFKLKYNHRRTKLIFEIHRYTWYIIQNLFYFDCTVKKLSLCVRARVLFCIIINKKPFCIRNAKEKSCSSFFF